MKKIVPLIVAVSALLYSSCTKNIDSTSTIIDSKNIAVAVAIPCDKPGTPVVTRAYVVISADDMDTIVNELIVEPCKVYGSINNIPVGRNRHVEIEVYGYSGNLCYKGEGTTDIENGVITTLKIKLNSVSGSLDIVGTICDDSVSNSEEYLLAHYPFEEIAGDSILDASLNGWNGMSFQGVRGAGFLGKGMSFTAGAYVAFDTIIANGTPEGTVEFYLKVNPDFDTASSMAFFGNDGARCNFVYTKGQLAFLKNHSDIYKIVTANVKFIPGVWYHIAGTWGNRGMKLFLNDMLVAYNTDTTAYESSPAGIDWGSKFYIGKKSLAGMLPLGLRQSLTFTGSIDEIKIYSIQKY